MSPFDLASKHRNAAASILTAAIIVLASSSACVTLEVGIEQPPIEVVMITPAAAASATLAESGQADDNQQPTRTHVATSGSPGGSGSAQDAPAYVLPTATPEYSPPPVVEAAPTSVPLLEYGVPSTLRIVYLNGGKVWLWRGDKRGAVLLSDASESTGAKISDDGELVAFTRGEELFVVNSDGSGERVLVSPALSIRPIEAGTALNRFEWVPGRHVVAYNTRVRSNIGQVLNDDLHLVDADTHEQTMLLPPGEGGEFHFSPDGSRIAVVTPGSISLIDANGENRQDDVLTYTPVATHSEFRYYAVPSWADDGSALRVVIPPADPLAAGTQHATIWHIPADGSPAWFMDSIEAAPSLSPEDAIRFSPDLVFVAYVGMRLPEGGSLADAQAWLEVRRLESLDVIAYPDVHTLYGWAPDSRHFAFSTDRNKPHLKIGQWSGATVDGPLDAGTVFTGLRWVDASHYLLLRNQGREWDLVLCNRDGSSTILAKLDGMLDYDFTTAMPAG